MRVLMLGWELAPHITGGLGRACERIVGELAPLGAKIDFVVPRFQSVSDRSDFALINLDFMSPKESAGPKFSLLDQLDRNVQKNFTKKHVETRLEPYRRSDADPESKSNYDGNLLLEVQEYASKIREVSAGKTYDVIHAHDWLTFPAGVELSQKLGIPLIAHFHSIETDRNPGYPDPVIQAVERMAVQNADQVIAVSRYTQNCLEREYGLAKSKQNVIYNGTDTFGSFLAEPLSPAQSSAAKTVLFVGRLTQQKGVQHLCQIAEDVLRSNPGTNFVVAGDGHMRTELIEMIAERGLSERMKVVGKLEGADIKTAYRSADVLIMPSISEPFGLVATEAIEQGIPVVLSDKSGVSEILPGAFVGDPTQSSFAGLISLLLQNPQIGHEMVERLRGEMRSYTWSSAADQIFDLYQVSGI